MDDNVTFIQIMGTSRLKPQSAKPKQLTHIEKSINDTLSIKGSDIKTYRLFYGNQKDFENGEVRHQVISFLMELCK